MMRTKARGRLSRDSAADPTFQEHTLLKSYPRVYETVGPDY